METADSLRVRLPVFEGPLDLLLYLIRKHELDISEVSLASIADEFVAFIEAARELDLAAAGNFISTAATLMWLKSRWLLPPEEETPTDAEQEAEAGRLIQRLEDFQKLRDFIQSLQGLELRARASFPRPLTSELSQRLDDLAEAEPELDLDAFELLKAIQRVQEFAFPVPRDVVKEEIPLEEKMAELSSLVRSRVRVNLSTLLNSAHSVLEAVVLFLAALELARQRFLRISQPANYEEIKLNLRKDVPKARPDARA